MKAIILARGSEKKSYHLSEVVSKQLLLLGNKPMMYYPLSVFILGEIKEISLNVGFVAKKQFNKLVNHNIKSHYGEYLKKLI